ncbi:unnamed protein product [Allacma fusca]|uniref:Uncharacterized protein n=1 Tax=Allacma fusca TaxID=39272 RepID=A0A8J2L0Y6_9HEXA|nr:unnamed protein product [Allacma fusca]
MLPVLLIIGVTLPVQVHAADIVRIPALGKTADIGHFYDTHTDGFFVKGFKESIPKQFTTCLKNPKVTFRYYRIRSFSDVLESFNINVEAKASFRFGLANLEATYGYAADASMTSDYQHVIAAYDTEVTTELMSLNNTKVLGAINLCLGKHLGVTHIVIGVVWGTQSRVHIRWVSGHDTATGTHHGNINIDAQDRLAAVQRNYRRILKHQDMLHDDVPVRATEQFYNFTTAASHFHMRLKLLFSEARTNTSGIMSKFADLKDECNGHIMGLTYYNNVIAEQTIHLRKVQEKAWLHTLGIQIMPKDINNHQMRVFILQRFNVTFLLGTDAKTFNKTRWFDNVAERVRSQVVKYYVDCDIPEIRSTSCVDEGFIPTEGSLLRSFKKIDWRTTALFTAE